MQSNSFSFKGQALCLKGQALCLFQINADGTMMLSTTAELGNTILQVPNPFAGEEGQPETLPFSLQGTHTAVYMVWRATGRNTFEAYGASLYHRPAEFDAPPISPAPFSGIARIWLNGEAVDGQILLDSKFTVDACTEEDGCPDPTENILSYDEAPFPEGQNTGTLNRFRVK